LKNKEGSCAHQAINRREKQRHAHTLWPTPWRLNSIHDGAIPLGAWC